MMKKKQLTMEERLEAAKVPQEEWPYELPNGWTWVRLGKVVDWSSGGTPSRKVPEYFTGDILWIKTGEIKGTYIYDTEEKITKEALEHSSAKIFPEKTVLLAMYGATIGKVGIMGKEAATNQACACGSCSSLVDYLYLFHFLASQKSKFIQLGRGGAQPNISQTIIKNYVMPLPPLAEQHRIVRRIESLFAKLNEAEEKLEAASASFATRKAAILHAAFSGKLTKKWRQESGKLEFHKIDMKLKDACVKITDGTHHSPPNMLSGDYMYVTAKNIREDGIDLHDITYVNKEIHEEIYARCDVKKGDVLYIKDGATAGIATVNELDAPFSMLSSVAVLRTNRERLLPSYLKYLLNSPETRSEILSRVSGNAITRLTLKKIKETVLPICDLDEQREIVRILDDLLPRESRAASLASSARQQIKTLRASILAKAFRGEL